MKKILISIFALLIFMTAKSQNAGLTKKETIEYIQKRLASTQGYLLKWKFTLESEKKDVSVNVKVTLVDIDFNNEKVEIKCNTEYNFGDNDFVYQDKQIFTFDPSKIKDTEIAKRTYADNSLLVYFRLVFTDSYLTETKSSRSRSFSEWKDWETKAYTLSSAEIPVLRDDAEKLKKAFIYLRDLVKAEDPFLN